MWLQYTRGRSSKKESHHRNILAAFVDSTKVQCDCCDKMQHQHCYALERRELDETHVCYTCLLQSAEPTLLERVKSLVQLRKALWSMRSQGIPSSKAALARLIGKHSSIYRLM